MERASRLVAIEYDRALAAMLSSRYTGRGHVEIVQGDVLDTDLAALAGGPYRLVGNIPYNVTTPIVFHAAQPHHVPRSPSFWSSVRLPSESFLRRDRSRTGRCRSMFRRSRGPNCCSGFLLALFSLRRRWKVR